MENNKISLGQRGGEKVDFASFLPTKQQKKQKMPYRQRQKSHKLWFEIISNGTPKFPYKFKEILPYVELIICNNNNKVCLKNFQNGLQVFAGVSFQND